MGPHPAPPPAPPARPLRFHQDRATVYLTRRVGSLPCLSARARPVKFAHRGFPAPAPEIARASHCARFRARAGPEDADASNVRDVTSYLSASAELEDSDAKGGGGGPGGRREQDPFDGPPPCLPLPCRPLPCVRHGLRPARRLDSLSLFAAGLHSPPTVPPCRAIVTVSVTAMPVGHWPGASYS